MDEYFKGNKLYGDDFDQEQIEKWFKEEEEGYADIRKTIKIKVNYTYHNLNEIHGYNKIPNRQFDNVLGFGSAWGYEFEPIIDRIKNLTIIEPSEQLINNKIKHIHPKYIKPHVTGTLDFPDNSFDLITCFGTLHHIPNVTHVLNEMIRVLTPNGYLLVREPIQSMGDWTKKRSGLTNNERGIPPKIFEAIFASKNVSIISKSYCFCMTNQIRKITNSFLSHPLHYYKPYIILDKYFPAITSINHKYHPIKKWHRIAPNSAFYVVKK
jgi:SAM-dependent methyltransferase